MNVLKTLRAKLQTAQNQSTPLSLNIQPKVCLSETKATTSRDGNVLPTNAVMRQTLQPPMYLNEKGSEPVGRASLRPQERLTQAIKPQYL
ncbi:hypothetical protein PsAD13_05558 [Pseudovibrio sp. Ad13]|nr:hypothetical protein PsAD13_05558 [Pseudovibrio sp. Ad13]